MTSIPGCGNCYCQGHDRHSKTLNPKPKTPNAQIIAKSLLARNVDDEPLGTRAVLSAEA